MVTKCHTIIPTVVISVSCYNIFCLIHQISLITDGCYQWISKLEVFPSTLCFLYLSFALKGLR